MSGKKRLTPENRRAVIVAAALEVFGDAGYDRASMRAVAKAAGITTPVLYDHFASKADLYAAVVEAQADDLIAHWEGTGFNIPDGSAEDMFAESVRTIFDWAVANPAGWRVIFLDAPSDPVVAEAHRRRQERASTVLAAQFAEVSWLHLSVPILDRPRANEFLAEATKATVNAIAAWWWNNRDLRPEEIMSLAHDLLWCGLGHVTGEPV
ncbi:TetR/AcrR family transcriptional regulator [Actinophytocola sp. NPDC049390]|uniref:TetR/AcrR family transcriptional regulator n=1 Tax=Actinophytocola sp. NPDC049390 TaxID=3363894 RepID=UPI0037B3C817